MNKTIQIQVPEGKVAEWQEIDGKTILVAVDEVDNRPVTERIKTFEDACNELGRMAEKGDDTAANLLSDYESNGNNILVKQTLATMKLSIIAHALNEGWQPQFTTNECRFAPWFYLYTKKEMDKMDEVNKKKMFLFGVRSNYGAYCGLAYAYSNATWSSTYANLSACLAVKSEALAKYFGQQFIDIWSDYVALPRKEE